VERLRAEAGRLSAEAERLRAEAERLRAEADAAAAVAEKRLEREWLSESEKRYIHEYVKQGWVRPPALHISKPLQDGDMGVPYYGGDTKNSSSDLAVDRIISSDSIVVRAAAPGGTLGGAKDGLLWIKNVNTMGLTEGARIDLKRVFVVERTRPYATQSGELKRVPYLIANNVEEVGLALASEEVKQWGRAEAMYRDAKATENRRRAEAEAARKDAELEAQVAERVRQLAEAEKRKKQEAAKAEAARRAEEEYDAHGLVLLLKTVEGTRGQFGGEITGTVVNRRNRKLSYAQITFNLSGPKLGSCVSSAINHGGLG
jgi:hypothetical protein